jgi:hypothetical protein
MEREYLTVEQLIALLQEQPNQNAYVIGEGCDCYNPVNGVSTAGDSDSPNFRVVINVDV